MGLWAWLRGGRPVAEPAEPPGPRFRVVVVNDETHSFEYVVELLQREAGLPFRVALALTHAIDLDGRAVVFTGTRAEADLLRDRVRAAGPDPVVPTSTGPLQVFVEEAG